VHEPSRRSTVRSCAAWHHERRKLITTQSSNHVRAAEPGTQHLSHQNQRGISGRVAVQVVDGLQVIQVEREEERTSLLPPRPLPFPLCERQESTPVVESREVIGKRQR